VDSREKPPVKSVLSCAILRPFKLLHPCFGVSQPVPNAPQSEQPAEWRPLKVRPPQLHDDYTVLRVSGDYVELETPDGLRYRRVKHNGKSRWYSLRTNMLTRGEKAKVEVFCPRLHKALGKFIDRSGSRHGPHAGAVAIFSKDQGKGSLQISMEITHCPF